MEMTITLREAGLIMIGVGIIILIFYTISFMRHLVQSVKHTNKILEDAKVVTQIAAERAKDVDKAVVEITTSVGNISEIMKGNQNIISALTSIINALGSLKNILKKERK